MTGLSGIIIRAVNEDDIAGVLDIYRQSQDFLALGPDPVASEAMVKADIELSRLEGGIYCGIYRDGGMIGVVDYIPGGFEGVVETGFISLLMIAVPHRGAGVGAAVVEQVEKICRRKRVTVMRTAVQVNNPDALRFWQKMEYEVISGPELRPDSTTVYQLRKNIV